MGGVCICEAGDVVENRELRRKERLTLVNDNSYSQTVESASSPGFQKPEIVAGPISKPTDFKGDGDPKCETEEMKREQGSVDIEDEQLEDEPKWHSELSEDVDDEHWGVGTPFSVADDTESNSLDFDRVESNPLVVGAFVALSPPSSGLASLDELEPSGIEEEELHPPLDKSTLRMELLVFNICAEDSTDLAKSRSRSLVRKRTHSKAMTKKPKTQTIQLKTNYLRGSKSTLLKSAKHRSRECDNNIMDIRETIGFKMETRSNGRLAGHFEVLAKQITGKFSKDKVIGYASIPLALYLKSGIIARNGDSTDMTVDFFAKSKAQLTKETKEDMEDFGIEDEPVSDQPVVARMDVKFRLFWDKKIWNAFHLRIAAEQKSDCLTTNPLDLMKLSAAKLKLDIVGAVMNQESMAEWMQMDLPEMCETMEHMGSKIMSVSALAEPCDAHSHAMIRVERRIHGADDVRRGEEYMSKTKGICFIGEQFVFDVAPFYQRTAVAKITDSISSSESAIIHPELEYYDFDGGEENPAYLLLTVEKSKHSGGRVEHGCALLKICSLLEKATLAVGSRNSDEVIFAEAMFQPLTRTTRKKQRKQPLLKTGFILCKCCFEWQ